VTYEELGAWEESLRLREEQLADDQGVADTILKLRVGLTEVSLWIKSISNAIGSEFRGVGKDRFLELLERDAEVLLERIEQTLKDAQ
jgi:hypothetical protein